MRDNITVLDHFNILLNIDCKDYWFKESPETDNFLELHVVAKQHKDVNTYSNDLGDSFLVDGFFQLIFNFIIKFINEEMAKLVDCLLVSSD